MTTSREFRIHPTGRGSSREKHTSSGTKTTYRPAKSLEEVILAWRNVHQVYLKSGLIDDNPQGIHLVPQAVSPATLIVMTEPPAGMSSATAGDVGIATISGYPDIGEGLPLDDVFKREMDELRAAGRSLMEVGLLADGREGKGRCMETKFDLMRWIFYYGLYSGQTDLILGVHPRHVAFYRRFLGCIEFAAESTCPRVNDARVVGLRLDLVQSLCTTPPPRGIKNFLSEPITRDDLADRFMLRWSAIEGTVIGDYLGQHREAPRYVNRLAKLDAQRHPWNSRYSAQRAALSMS